MKVLVENKTNHQGIESCFYKLLKFDLSLRSILQVSYFSFGSMETEFSFTSYRNIFHLSAFLIIFFRVS